MTLFSFKYKDEKITAGEMPSFLQSKYNYYKNFSLTEALRSTIENTDSDVCKVTISAGVSKIIDYDIQKSVNAADEALYKAKESGRNNVKFK